MVAGQRETGQESSHVVGAAVVVDRTAVAGDDYIFALGGFDEIDDIGHGDNSGILIEHGSILYLKILAFPECLVDWISFEHEGHFSCKIEADDIVVLL